MKNEKNKVLKLLEFLITDAIIDLKKDGIFIQNFKYNTNIKLEALPDGNFKVEFAIKNNKNPFKKLNENLGECFILPIELMKFFLNTLAQELTVRNNLEIINNYGQKFIEEKVNEVINILNQEKDISEDFQHFILTCENETFNNLITVGKSKNEDGNFLGHDYIKIKYSYLMKSENDEKSYCKVQTLTIHVSSLNIKKFKVLSKCFKEPLKNNYESIIEILKESNIDTNMNKLLMYTELSENLDDGSVKKTTNYKI